MWSHQWVIDVTANFPPRFSFSSLLYFRLYVYQLFPLKTAIGLFLFLSFDAQVRGTGDVVNSLKSEGGWGAGSRALWVVASAGCLTGHDERSCCLSFKMEAPVLLYSPCGVTADSDSPKPKWMNEPVLLLWLFFHVFNLYLPVSHTGECLCGGGPMAQLLRLGDVAVLVRRRLAPLDVLLVDEHLNALLDHADTGVEPGFGLIDDLHGPRVEKQHTTVR